MKRFGVAHDDATRHRRAIVFGYAAVAADNDDNLADPFAPPQVPCEVVCLHCGASYESWQIEWRELDDAPFEGAWCCPTPGCCAVGYGFDILPADIVDEDDEDAADEDDVAAHEDDDDEVFETFGTDAIWLDVGPLTPPRRILGNTPQPPFDRMPADDAFVADQPSTDDDLPF